LVLNSPELRSALKGVYEGAETLTEAEWKALLGARRQLEAGAARQRREWLQEATAESGLPLWMQWGIVDRLKSRDFAPEELEAEIQAAWEKMAETARAEMESAKEKVTAV
jgi:hypothetical protein